MLPIVHLELHTGDQRGASALYAELCGWRAQEVDTGAGRYLALALGHTNDGMDGGIVECPTERALWLPYVEVEDVVAATDHARRCGAAVLLSPREGPVGWRSVISSCAGGQIAFWQPKR
jgi:predicted enzyme related to lactoylglutathione lyase